MIEWFTNLNPIVQALIATCFTWFMTISGAAVVFARRNMGQKALVGMLGFAAGAMIFVVIEELVPESQTKGHSHEATPGAVLGFAAMMMLDVALG